MVDPTVAAYFAALAALDEAALASTLANDVRALDPVFGDLEGPDVRRRWRLLCARTTRLSLAWEVDRRVAGPICVRWRADQVAGGRRLVFAGATELVVRAGLVVHERHDFGFWHWARQALGLGGLVLGWSAAYRARVHRRARERLVTFETAGR